jgi:tetratricopeptide (TPR) repeat protein
MEDRAAISAQEKSFRKAVFGYLEDAVNNTPDDRLRQSLLSNLEALRSGLSVDGTTNVDLFSLFQTHGPKETTTPTTTPTPTPTTEKEDEFVKYIELLNKKGYFNGTEVGTPLYEARLDKAKQRFAAKYVKNPEQHKDAGNEFVRKGSFKEALTEYTLAIEGEPNNAIYYANRGFAYQKLNNHEQAIADLDKAISLNPNYAKAYPRLASSYLFLGNVPKAIEATDKGLAIEPANEALLKMKSELNALQQLPNMAGLNPGEMPFNVPPGMPGMPNFFELMNNPEIVAMASQLVQNNPEIMNFARQVAENPQMIQQLFSTLGAPPGSNPTGNNDM